MKQLLFLLLFPAFAMAQYPSNSGHKIRLGEQTTADGLVYRGVASIDTVTATSKITRANKLDTSAFLLLDTVTNLLWHYKTASNGWIQAGGGVSVTSFSAGTTGLTPSTATTGAVTLGGTLAVANGGTGTNMSSLPNNYLIRKNASGFFDTSAVYEAGGNVGIGVEPTNISKLDLSGQLRIRASGYTTSSLESNLLIVGNTNNTGLFTGTIPPSLFVVNRRTSNNSLARIGFNAGDGDVYGYFIADGYGAGLNNDGLPVAGLGMVARSTSPLLFVTDNLERVRITSTGNVGIGTQSPSARLQVKGSATVSEFALRVEDSGSNNLLSVQNNGNVGIGTTTPMYLLSLGVADKGFSEYKSGSTPNNNHSIKVMGNSNGANFGVQNLNSSGFSGIEYINFNNNIGVFTGLNNSNNEYRVNNIMSRGTINFLIDGTSSFYIDSVNNGRNVGINTNAPTQKLHVVGNGLFTGSVTAGSFIPTSSTIPTNGMYLPATNTLGFSTNGTKKLTLDASGNLGLGVTPSSANLPTIENQYGFFSGQAEMNLTANSYYNSGFKYISTGSYAARYHQSGFNGQHQWFTAPSGTAGNAITFTQAMTLDASGNLGIGTTSPNTRLQINGTPSTDWGNITLFDSRSAAIDQGGMIAFGGYKTSTSAAALFAQIVGRKENSTAGNEAGYLAFLTNNNTTYSERMRITSGGNVGIGTATPGNNKLNVNGDMYANGDIRSQGIYRDYQGEALLQTNTSAVTQLGSSGAGTPRQIAFLAGNTERVRITSDGEVWIGYTTDQGAYPLQVNGQIFATNATIATSDEKFKENITPLSKGLEIVSKLKPVTFNFINDTENNFSEYEEVGFIAQDVERALSTETFSKSIVKSADDSEPTSTMGLATQNLIPILVKAIQEQQALIKALEQRIINLENK